MEYSFVAYFISLTFPPGLNSISQRLSARELVLQKGGKRKRNNLVYWY
jgi:hypothetical protein